MRQKLPMIAATTAAATVTIVVLILAAALTRSPTVVVASVVLVVAIAIAATVAAIRMSSRLHGRDDHRATRVANLERRVAALQRLTSGSTAPTVEDDTEGRPVEDAGPTVAELLERIDGLEQALGDLQADHAQLELHGTVQDTALAELQEDLTDRIRRSSAELTEVAGTADAAWSLSTRSALQSGRHPRAFLSLRQAVDLFQEHLASDRLLDAIPYIRSYGVLARLDLATLRHLYRWYRTAGYWDVAARVQAAVALSSGMERDKFIEARLRSDIAVFSAPERLGLGRDLEPATAYDPQGPILHMVGKTLPHTQSGYTLRTHRTVRAQRAIGLDAVVVGQSGILEDSPEVLLHHVLHGVDYHVLPGPLRSTVTTQDWLQNDTRELAALVRRLRPSVLHAHSDLYNALLVVAVGRAYGIPTVYEARGFWEESWLTRTITTQGWQLDSAAIFETFGHPDAYILRKHAEEVARSMPDHVITLADVMRRHILEAPQGSRDPETVTVVPNGVDPEEFPVVERDPDLADRWGIPADAVTIGYISSMVEYESIETLIDAFALAVGRVRAPLRLLLVGEGPHRASLEEHARRVGCPGVIFTGPVPHAEIVGYYGLIDVFVVPRRASSVAELVTPLKPFEAFSTGRAVVLSDAAALQEIADQSGAAAVFRAGYPRDLSRQIVRLAQDPAERRALGARAAHWVRSHRTWEGNAQTYAEVYRRLGRGDALGRNPDPVPREPGGGTSGVRRAAVDDRPAPDARETMQGAGPAEELESTDRPDRARRAVVVAMKPKIAGRIRRNIITLLELGFDVTVVNSTAPHDFLQGLRHPRLTVDFVEVRSLAVRYQAGMTRRKEDRERKREQAQKTPADQPITGDGTDSHPLPSGTVLANAVRAGWDSSAARNLSADLERSRKRLERRLTRWRSSTRTRRELAIRNRLKKVHLVNRFVEFWRLSPARIAGHHPDIVVSSDLPGLVGASIAARRLGVPHLHDCHELYLESTALKPAERRALWPVEREFLRRADAVLVVNTSIRDEYERRYGVRGTVLRNAAPEIPDHVRRSPMDLRLLAGIPRRSRVVLYQGGLMAGRGLDVCVRAAAHLPADVHLLLIGSGRCEEELRALAREVGVDDRVHLLPAVPPADLAAYTVAADVGLIPYQPVSRNNQLALPNKVFEYTAAGVPFVAADLPEIRAIVDRDGCGLVYDPFDPEALASAVIAVLDPAGHDGFRRAADRFGRVNSWERERRILVGEIERLMDDRFPGPTAEEPARTGIAPCGGGPEPAVTPASEWDRAEPEATVPSPEPPDLPGEDLQVQLEEARKTVEAQGTRLVALAGQLAEEQDRRRQSAEKLRDTRDKLTASRDIVAGRLRETRDRLVHTSGLWTSSRKYFSLFRQGLLADEIEKADESFAADTYLCLLPSTVPAALELKRLHGGRIICDCVENVEVEKHSLAPKIHPAALGMVNLSAYGALSAVDGLMTVSDAVAETLERFGPPVRVQPNYRRYEEPEPDPSLRRLYGLKDSDRLVVTSGNIVKGFESVIDAVALLPEDVHLVALSKFSPPEYDLRVREHLAASGVEHRVHLHGFIPYAQLAGVLTDADLGIITLDPGNPNHAVSLPNRVFDFTTSTLPFVAPQLRDIARYVEAHGCGVTIEETTPEAWADGVRRVIEGLDQYRDAMRRARAEVTWESLDDGLLEHLGNPRSVTLLGFRDLTRYQRFLRVADSLTSRGVAVKAVFFSEDPAPLRNPAVEFFSFADRYGQGPGPQRVPHQLEDPPA